MVNQNCYRQTPIGRGNTNGQSLSAKEYELSAQSRMQECNCRQDSMDDMQLPLEDKGELLSYINRVSFAAYDAMLYLDTHPGSEKGTSYFMENNRRRQNAIREYTRIYGPLNLSEICEKGHDYRAWVEQPWPWEGGHHSKCGTMKKD